MFVNGLVTTVTFKTLRVLAEMGTPFLHPCLRGEIKRFNDVVNMYDRVGKIKKAVAFEDVCQEIKKKKTPKFSVKKESILRSNTVNWIHFQGRQLC